MKKKRRLFFILLVAIAVIISILTLFLSRKFTGKRTPIILRTSSGVETIDFQPHDSILLEAVGLSPRTGYSIEITREDEKVLRRLRLSTNQEGRIPETIIWYNVGVRPYCKEKLNCTGNHTKDEEDYLDREIVGYDYILRISDKGKIIHEKKFNVKENILRPILYPADDKGRLKSGFLIGEEDVYVVGKNFPKGSIIRLWVAPPGSNWRARKPLKDMRKKYEGKTPPIFKLKGNETSFMKLLWPKKQGAIGSYDIVADVVVCPFFSFHPLLYAKVQNVVSSLVDGLNKFGFNVAEVRVDTISFNYDRKGAVEIFDDTSGNTIIAPEYFANGMIAKPAAWLMKRQYSVKVKLKAVSGVNSAEVWAENGMGGLKNSAPNETIEFTRGRGQGYFKVNNVPDSIGKHIFEWEWKYKNVNGITSDNKDIGTTGSHIIYTLLDKPQAPQATPWVEVLDIACSLTSGMDTADSAMREIWDDFYYESKGQYDTELATAQYTGPMDDAFDINTFIDNYNSGSIGTVNCYDMGKAVVVFSNALGCDGVYTEVDNFGYLNCVKLIGRCWTNNPKYNNNNYDNNPLADGDTSDDGIPNNHSGRSFFNNHGFSRLGSYIFDASLGQVDVDEDPDNGKSIIAHFLDGHDTWESYRTKVIDNIPSLTDETTFDDYYFWVDGSARNFDFERDSLLTKTMTIKNLPMPDTQYTVLDIIPNLLSKPEFVTHSSISYSSVVFMGDILGKCQLSRSHLIENKQPLPQEIPPERKKELLARLPVKKREDKQFVEQYLERKLERYRQSQRYSLEGELDIEICLTQNFDKAKHYLKMETLERSLPSGNIVSKYNIARKVERLKTMKIVSESYDKKNVDIQWIKENIYLNIRAWGCFEALAWKIDSQVDNMTISTVHQQLRRPKVIISPKIEWEAAIPFDIKYPKGTRIVYMRALIDGQGAAIKENKIVLPNKKRKSKVKLIVMTDELLVGVFDKTIDIYPAKDR